MPTEAAVRGRIAEAGSARHKAIGIIPVIAKFVAEPFQGHNSAKALIVPDRLLWYFLYSHLSCSPINDVLRQLLHPV